MANYVQSTFFTPKDTLPPNNPAKTIFGAAYDTEFGNIATAIATKPDNTTSASFLSLTVGTPTGGNLGAGSINAQSIAINGVAVIPGGAVSSVTGTANQVTAAPTVGAVVLSLPASVIFPGTITLDGQTGANISILPVGAGATTQSAFQYFTDNNLYIDAPNTGTPTGGKTIFRQDSSTPSLSISAARNVTIAAPTSGDALSVSGAGTSYATEIFGGGGVGNNRGLHVIAGSNSSDVVLVLTNAAQTANYLIVDGAGSIFTNGQTAEGAGTISAAGLFINGVAVTAGGGVTTGTFTGTITGCATAPTVTCKFTKIGNSVTLRVPALSAASNATTLSLTGLPAAIQPATGGVQTSAIGGILDSSSATGDFLGTCSVSGGTLTFLKFIGTANGTITTTAFSAASATKGWVDFSCTYDIT